MIRLTWTTWPRRSSERGERLNSGREARLSGETCRDRQTWTTRSWGPSTRILRSQNFRFKAKIIMGWDWPSFTIAGYYTSRVFQWKKCPSKSKVVEFEPRWISPMDFVLFQLVKLYFLTMAHNFHYYTRLVATSSRRFGFGRHGYSGDSKIRKSRLIQKLNRELVPFFKSLVGWLVLKLEIIIFFYIGTLTFLFAYTKV